MTSSQGDLSLLEDPIAQELLRSREPAQLAYVWTDGTPRIVPIWFHWNGRELVLGTPPGAPKLKALRQNPRVAVSINSNTWPYKVLLIRGDAALDPVEGVSQEYAAAAQRYFGAEGGQAWVDQVRASGAPMTRVVITPRWVGIIDFQTRFPSALSA